ncbi:MAG: TonB-dependent receptor [Bacteroidetes bacterium]|nr:TonB-dependent receptor [Bacteroidota bacterium]
MTRVNHIRLILSFIILLYIPQISAQIVDYNLMDDTINSNIDEVIITGSRIQKRVLDVPYPISRIDYREFKYDRKIGVNEVLESVPGVFLQSRYGNHDVKISIRGFGSKSKSGIRGVRILIDDIPESEPDGQTRIEAIDFNSIGKIEIAKGNLSSMYTNAPGGVINFINDISFNTPFVVQFNQVGSFGLRRNGFKFGYNNDNYNLLTSYSNHYFKGYRDHNIEKWNIINTVVETKYSNNSSLKLLLYFVDGMIKLPGSLTQEEFNSNPYQAEQRAIDRDTKRVSTKGRLGVRYTARFGRENNNELELTTYATIKYFERTNREYRIINRNGFGLRTHYLNESNIFSRKNEFLVGTDILFQPARIEYYSNINGNKGDQILQLFNEKIYNTGFYISNNYEVYDNRLFLLLSGRYDIITFDLKEETLPSRKDARTFEAFVPKVALNYKLTKMVSIYSSYGFSYDSPAKNELESFDPELLYNQELKPQLTKSFELGVKGFLELNNDFLNRVRFEATFFNLNIDNEVVPYEIYGDVYFRNAAKTNRRGFEIGTQVRLLKKMDLIIAYTYSDFIYDSYSALTIEIDSIGNITEEEKNFSGKVVPSVPVNNLFVSLNFSQNITKSIELFAKLSLNSVSGLWVDDANSDRTNAYNILNSMLGIDIKAGGFYFVISGGVSNILDEVYVGFVNTNSAEQRFYEPGEPLNLFGQFNIGYKF